MPRWQTATLRLTSMETSHHLRYGNIKEEVRPKEEEYLRAKVMASLYLDDEANKIMSDALGAFRQANMAIWLNIPDEPHPANRDSYNSSVRNLDWARFSETYEKAVECLRGVLNPQVLRQIERPK